ncbi:hypothetical protein ACFXPX_03305 [Kitasatospora sp. NPDC059146]|uniref:hypothetical protein n=1 Tax=unclassified Kitasatospora TaxID=2633591 RepID=UPI0036A70A63
MVGQPTGNPTVSAAEALAYYANGWYAGGDTRKPQAPLAWENPEARCIIDVRGSTWTRYLRRARRKVEAGGFELRWNTAFDEVLASCAVGRKPGEGTWIDSSMSTLYRELHHVGAAHSAEAWLDNRLVGGVVGMGIGRWLSMETTFHSAPDAGHAAVAAMAELMDRRGCLLVDVQQLHSFTRKLGGVEIPRDSYLRLLRAALDPTLAPPPPAASSPTLIHDAPPGATPGRPPGHHGGPAQ